MNLMLATNDLDQFLDQKLGPSAQSGEDDLDQFLSQKLDSGSTTTVPRNPGLGTRTLSEPPPLPNLEFKRPDYQLPTLPVGEDVAQHGINIGASALRPLAAAASKIIPPLAPAADAFAQLQQQNAASNPLVNLAEQAGPEFVSSSPAYLAGGGVARGLGAAAGMIPKVAGLIEQFPNAARIAGAALRQPIEFALGNAATAQPGETLPGAESGAEMGASQFPAALIGNPYVRRAVSALGTGLDAYWQQARSGQPINPVSIGVNTAMAGLFPPRHSPLAPRVGEMPPMAPEGVPGAPQGLGRAPEAQPQQPTIYPPPIPPDLASAAQAARGATPMPQKGVMSNAQQEIGPQPQAIGQAVEPAQRPQGNGPAAPDEEAVDARLLGPAEQTQDAINEQSGAGAQTSEPPRTALPDGVVEAGMQERPGKPPLRLYNDLQTKTTLALEPGDDLNAAVAKARAPKAAPPESVAPEPESAKPEPTPEPGKRPTSIKNAVVDRELAEMGLPPAKHGKPLVGRMEVAKALQKLRNDPMAGQKLVEKLDVPEPPAMSGPESAMLAMEKRRVMNERNQAEDEKNKARDAGDEAGAHSAHMRAIKAADDLMRIQDVATRAGTPGAQGQAFRKMMVNEDYSLAALERRERASHGGKELSQAEKDAIAARSKADADRFAELQKRVSEHEATIERMRQEQAMARAHADLTRPGQPQKPAPKGYGSRNKYFTKERYETRKNELNAMMAHMNVGIDPSFIKPLAEMGAFHIEAGARELGAWVAKMKEAFPKLKSKTSEEMRPVWDESQKQFLEAKAKGAGDKRGAITDWAKEKGDDESLAKAAQRLYRLHGEAGVKGRENLVDAVHGDLKKAFPDLTRREAMDAISGYGKFKAPSTKPVDVELAQRRQEMLQLAKIRDMEAKQPPLKSGFGRTAPSDENRALTKQVNELKRQGGYQVRDPERAVQSALASMKTRMRNEIADKKLEIATGERIVKGKTEIIPDAEAKQLRAELDDLNKQYKMIFPPENNYSPPSYESRLAQAEKAAQASLARIEAQIQRGGTELGKPEGPKIGGAKLDAIKAQRDAAREQLKQIQDLQKEYKDPKIAALQRAIDDINRQIAGGAPKGKIQGADTPEIDALKQKRDAAREQLKQARIDSGYADQAALQNYKLRQTRKIADLQNRAINGEPPPRPQPIPPKLDQEAQAAAAQIKQLEMEREKRLARNRMAARAGWVKVADAIPQYSRAGMLSWPTVLGKLTAAAGVLRPAHSLAREGVISGLRLLQPELAGKAARFGSGFQLSAEVKAYTTGMIRAWKAFGAYVRNKTPDEVALYGRKHNYDPEWSSFIGNWHAALKTPAMMSEFERSLYKRNVAEIKAGNDPFHDEVIKLKTGMAAMEDAYRAISQQQSASGPFGLMTNGVKAVLQNWEKIDKETGQPEIMGKVGASIIKTLMPIMKVPANLADEALEHVHGTVVGGLRSAHANMKGIEKLSPDKADSIMRQQANGVIGLAAMALGWHFNKQIGNFYQLHDKRKPGDLQPGDIETPVGRISHTFAHHAAIQAGQVAASARGIMESKLRKSDTEKRGFWDGAFSAIMGLAAQTPFGQEESDMKTLLESPAAWGRKIIPARVIPGVAQWAAQQLDKDASGHPVRRKPQNMGQAFQMMIPGMRQNVPKYQPKSRY